MLAIVLSRRDFREFDQLVSLYTEEQGKVEPLARGIKKITAKNAAALEPFALLEAEIAPGREIDHLTRAQTRENFVNIRQELAKTALASFALKLMDSLVGQKAPDPRIFELLLGLLRFIDRAAEARFSLLDAFALKLCGCLGFAPLLDHCAICRLSVIQIIPVAFDLAGGGMVCANCQSRIKSSQLIPLAPADLGGLRLILTDAWEQINTAKMDLSATARLHQIVFQFALFHSGQKITDWRAVDKFI